MSVPPDRLATESVVASPELFVDTSAWFPLLLSRHPQHAHLAGIIRGRVAAGERMVTTNLVLAETHALLLYRGHRAPGFP